MFLNAEELLNSLNIEIENIEEDRKYWLVRTDGGIYYNNFLDGSYISIGWNEFLNKSDFRNEKANENIKERLLKEYPDKQPGRIYSQIRNFIYEINIGDVVMIPSEKAEEISFGIITSEVYNKEVTDESFIKSRKVNWIKHIEKDSLDPYLFKMMQAHQAINKANEYAHYIDRTMYSLYRKGKESFLILPVKRESDIPAYDLSQFLNSLIDTVRLINKFEDQGNSYDLRDLDIKLNIQSPGFVELVSTTKDLIHKIVVIVKNALNANQTLTNELLTKTSPEKLKELEEQSKKIQQNFEHVKAELPKDIYKKTPLE
ncbi:hypothetical protein [Bacillus cereus]|uniref:hypothetical protein n=1 Tax=Bacillus cereus TaxID=1396 RepID=UPI000936912E|nr:hypothetical protein [Bacillus cereus]OKA27490.1 hypothetical protein BJR05_16315 [Bacillus cereus]